MRFASGGIFPMTIFYLIILNWIFFIKKYSFVDCHSFPPLQPIEVLDETKKYVHTISNRLPHCLSTSYRLIKCRRGNEHNLKTNNSVNIRDGETMTRANFFFEFFPELKWKKKFSVAFFFWWRILPIYIKKLLYKEISIIPVICWYDTRAFIFVLFFFEIREKLAKYFEWMGRWLRPICLIWFRCASCVALEIPSLSRTFSNCRALFLSPPAPLDPTRTVDVYYLKYYYYYCSMMILFRALQSSLSLFNSPFFSLSPSFVVLRTPCIFFYTRQNVVLDYAI